MGHTLVANFDPPFNEFLHGTLDPAGANKVPFGRQCDRSMANRTLDYHMTLVHWAEQDDAFYLPKITGILFPQFMMTVTESTISEAQENSWILYFPLKPGERYDEALNSIRSALQISQRPFPHMTLAISKNLEQIKQIKRLVDGHCRYPFTIHADALDLYHIWQPVRKVCRIYGINGDSPSHGVL